MNRFDWNDISRSLDFDPGKFIISIIMIIVVFMLARLLLAILTKMTTRIIERSKDIEDENRRKSVVTSMTLLRSLGRYLIYFLAICVIVYQLGYGSLLTNIIAAAGVGALVISFGAQSIIKDLLAGIFISFEKQFSVGDFVKINEFEGTVSSLAMRCTYLKTWSGQRIIIPNGQISTVINYSQDYNTAVVDVPIPYEADIKKVVTILKEVATAYHDDNPDICIEEPAVLAINAFNDSSMTVTIHQKTKDRKQFQIQRDLRVLIKERFDEEGIAIPYSQIVIHKED